MTAQLTPGWPPLLLSLSTALYCTALHSTLHTPLSDFQFFSLRVIQSFLSPTSLHLPIHLAKTSIPLPPLQPFIFLYI
ncbi:hypothetical protein DFP73DRAFT_551647 [Morchella snyderi]|nr:hypothetical protein DFP73DRAFT_551647 [Morchella snyderi]